MRAPINVKDRVIINVIEGIGHEVEEIGEPFDDITMMADEYLL